MNDLKIGHPGGPPVIDPEDRRAAVPQEQIGRPGLPPVLDLENPDRQRFAQNDAVEISFLPPTESNEPVQQEEQIPRLDITV